ncbi:MAG: hypothetical protein PUI85_04055 [Eubacteriales bacterium]|nr:hypothetical protein [Eubacteriales bacterium]MDY3332333.1 hypothetical protein [Gallibacter sp.]
MVKVSEKKFAAIVNKFEGREQEGYKLFNIAILIIGFLYVACFVVNSFINLRIWQLIPIVLSIFLWIVVVQKLLTVRKLRVEFRKAFLFSLGFIPAVLLYGVIGLKDLKAIPDSAFVEFSPMFFKFGAMVCLYFVLYFVVRGLVQIKASKGNVKEVRQNLKRVNLYLKLLVASVILTPVLAIFSGYLGLILSGIMAAISFVMLFLVTRIIE